jgi:hypothetical protein
MKRLKQLLSWLRRLPCRLLNLLGLLFEFCMW